MLSRIFCLIFHETFTENYLVQHTPLNKGTRRRLIFVVSGVIGVINSRKSRNSTQLLKDHTTPLKEGLLQFT